VKSDAIIGGKSLSGQERKKALKERGGAAISKMSPLFF
jgi:hypothetical protein